MNRIKTIKLMDRIIGPVLFRLLPKAGKVDCRGLQPQKILVIRPGGMGDALLLLPVLKEIFYLFKTEIDILCEPRNRSVFKSVTFINNIFSYQNPGSLISVLQNKYDAVFDTEQSHFLSAVITRLIKTDIRVGFKTNGREKIYNRTASYNHNIYEADMFRTLFETVFYFKKPFYFNFPYFQTSKKAFHLNCNKGEKLICLFPGATIEERRWPADRWANVINWVADNRFNPVLIGGSQEIRQCKEIVSHCRTDNIVNLCNMLSIIETAALFNQTTLLISTDSGILHLGVLCNISTISLFGSGIADKWGPKGNSHTIINKNLTCSPCTRFGTTPPCPDKNACMLQITPEDIIESVKTHLKKNINHGFE